jgi:predicted MFS family arabinose efflux permease
MFGRKRHFDGLRNALASPNYRIWTIGNSISLVGTWMHKVGVAWLTWQMTESGAWLGAVAFADMIPTLFVGPIAGALADRWDRLRVTRFGQAAMMVTGAVIYGLTVSGLMTVHILIALVALMGGLHSLGQPARLALIPNLVRKQNVVAAVAINSLIFNLARFVGPALAGIVIVWWGVAATFLLNTLSFGAFLYALFHVRLETADRVTEGEHDNLFKELAEGVMFAARHPGIRPALLSLVAVSTLARPAMELLAGFADAVFVAGAPGLSMLTSAIGLGAIVAGLILTTHVGTVGLVNVMLRNALLSAIGVLGFALTPSLWIAVPAIALAGFGLIGFGISMQTLVQMGVNTRMRGRILSLYSAVFKAGPALGALVMGVLSEHYGLQIPVAAGALILLVGLTWAWGRRKRYAAALEHPPGDDAAATPSPTAEVRQ